MLPYCGGPDLFLHVNQGVSLSHRVSVPQVVFLWGEAFSDQLELENAAY